MLAVVASRLGSISDARFAYGEFTMKIWIGRWIMGVSIIHTLFAIVVFKSVLASIVSRGVFNAVGADPLTGAVVWFVLFGIVLFVCGMATSALELATGLVLARAARNRRQYREGSIYRSRTGPEPRRTRRRLPSGRYR